MNSVTPKHVEHGMPIERLWTVTCHKCGATESSRFSDAHNVRMGFKVKGWSDAGLCYPCQCEGPTS